MSQPIQIRRGELLEIVDLRWRILRAGLPRTSAIFDGDEEPTTRHFVATQEEIVIGCATILQRPWIEKPAWQLRGMAIDEAFQKSGVGSALLEEIEKTVKNESHSRQLWCNARSPAMPFYLKHGWKTEGEEFVIPSAGPHYKMSKIIN